MKKLIVALILLPCLGFSQRLGRFGTGGNPATEMGYSDIKSFFGYADSAQSGDEINNDTAYFHLYFKLHDSVPDLGIRLISPVPSLLFPNSGDFVTDNYHENEKNRSFSFDPVLYLQRQSVQAVDDSLINSSIVWEVIAYNDNSKELTPATSSLIRIKEPLPPATYRLAFKSNENKVRGGFVVQVGTTGHLNQVKLVRKREELMSH